MVNAVGNLNFFLVVSAATVAFAMVLFSFFKRLGGCIIYSTNSDVSLKLLFPVLFALPYLEYRREF
jgi:hypothetical protein